MIDRDQVKYIYFLGIGGIGMSAIARYFNKNKIKVFGYDKTSTSLTDELISEGMYIHFEDDISQVPKELSKENTLIILTPAIPSEHTELNYFREKDFKIIKRSKILAQIVSDKFTIAVAGTHGKTTTSSIIAFLLSEIDEKPLAFLGGIANNFNSNFIFSNSSEIAVVEADEFDRSFLELSPDISIITSLDADHLDVYETPGNLIEAYNSFAAKTKTGGKLIHKAGLDVYYDRDKITYSISQKGDYQAKNIIITEGKYFFDLVTPLEEINNIECGIAGIHNVENAVGALAVIDHLKFDIKKAANKLKNYKGVKRRFEYRIRSKNLVYIDDYAHHPSELRMCIESVRQLYPYRKITGIFQPHLYSRTRDFADGFAESLSLLDELILLDIYPARETPIEGITSEIIFQKVSIPQKTLIEKSAVVDFLDKRKPEVLLTLGAGDVDTLVEPITKFLKSRI